jgi:hypothetical protein
MGGQRESAPWGSTPRVGKEQRPAEGSHRARASGQLSRRQRRCDCSRPPPPPTADLKEECCRPTDTAAALQGAPASRLRSGAGRGDRAPWCWPLGPAAPTGAASDPGRQQVSRPNPRRRASAVAGERGMGADMEMAAGGRVATTDGTAAASATEPTNRVPFPHWDRGHRVMHMRIRRSPRCPFLVADARGQLSPCVQPPQSA